MVTQPELDNTTEQTASKVADDSDEATAEATNITPQAQLPQDLPVPEVGRLSTPVQEREIQLYYVAEGELRMLETGPEGSERMWLGVAIATAIAFGIGDITIKNLSPYHHAIFLVGFWVGVLACFYFGNKTRRARSLTKGIASDVRKRPKDSLVVEKALQAPTRARWRLRWPLSRDGT